MSQLLLPIPESCPKENVKTREELGQFLTPPEIARFMASLFPQITLQQSYSVLDPGAGAGALTLAFLRLASEITVSHGKFFLYECDNRIIPQLDSNLADFGVSYQFKVSIQHTDFIQEASRMVLRNEQPFTHAILNPPYRKIASHSHERLCLRKAGIETTNLYSGFVSLSLALLKPLGHLVAIIPRSFCNGPYFHSFRKLILKTSAIRQIHLFESRKDAFSNVLQENVVIHLEKDGNQGNVKISKSTDASFSDYSICEHDFTDIVPDTTGESFFHIPAVSDCKYLCKANCKLSDLNLKVSTGPIVDFRMKEFIKKQPSGKDVPLLYPAHFNGGLSWPKSDIKKFNAISICSETIHSLYPNGWYTVVRRLSSKEEKRRIVAYVIDPLKFPNIQFLGFENHLNIFHHERHGLSYELAHGLARYLNSDMIDRIFRSFNGNTQVNATDLRSLLYPSLDLLCKIGADKTYPLTAQKQNIWLQNLLQ